MDTDKLEKLSELKDKGIITQEEFEIQKEKILKGGVTTNIKNWGKEAAGIIGLIVVIISACLSFQEMNFACDESSMKQAQDLINANFPNWNGALRLSNPTIAEQTENSLLCRVNTNLDELSVLHYKLNKQEDGSILIYANPIAEALSDSLEEWESSISEEAENFEESMNEMTEEYENSINNISEEW